MKKLFICALLLALLVLSMPMKDLFGAWTVTTNRIGRYSSEVTFISTSTNDTRTNYLRSAGLIRNKKVPLWAIPTIISNDGRVSIVGVSFLNKTNVVIFRNTGLLSPTYLKIKLYIQEPSKAVK